MTLAPKPLVPFEKISLALRGTVFPKVSAVVGILNGGRIPASLIAHQLSLPLFWLQISFRDEANHPLAADPFLLGDAPNLAAHKSILLVDDVSVTGKTFSLARHHLPDLETITVVLKGRADMVILPDLPSGCVQWPWNHKLVGDERQTSTSPPREVES